MNTYQLALYEALSGLSLGSYVPVVMSGSLHKRSATAQPRGQSLASTANSSTYKQTLILVSEMIGQIINLIQW